MPVRMSVDELRPGMKLVKPFVVKGRTMLQRNSALTYDEILKLRNRYPDLHLTVTDPANESGIIIPPQEIILIKSEEGKAIYQAIKEAGETLSVFLSLSKGSQARIELNTKRSLKALAEYPELSRWVHDRLKEDHPLMRHQLKVFYLSMVLGSKNLGYVAEERRRMSSASRLTDKTAKDLGQFGLGILLMDFSLYRLWDLFESDCELSIDEKRALLLHPQNSLEALTGNLPSLTKMMIKSHHENMIGKGFPNRIAADKIHVFARLVRIADAFIAATNDELFETEARTAVKALWEMSKGPYRFFYDPILIESFLRIIHPLPVGSKIKLVDGRYAVVVALNGDNALAPLVVVAFDSEGNKLENDALKGPFVLGQQVIPVSLDELSLDFLTRGPDRHQTPPKAKIDSAFDIFFP